MIKVFLGPDVASIRPQLSYLFAIWARNSQADVLYANTPDGALTIGQSDTAHIKVSDTFVRNDFGNARANDKGLIQTRDGRPDYLASAFYLLNGMQEYQENHRDDLGRFKYAGSLQDRYHLSKENIVQQCFNEVSRVAGLPRRKEKSRFFLTHDIDLVNGAIVEDGFNVLKKGRIDLFLKLLFNAAVARPDWLNMDKIMKLESEFDCKSVFFWLVNKGSINARERNSDYTFSSRAIQRQFQLLGKNGFENGLHKSISNESFSTELKKFGSVPLSNRYHYLKFNLPTGFIAVEDAGLKLDASLGFAEEIGFRNNYGLPYNPYDFRTNKPFSFVEVPLHIMDRTFFQYKKYPVQHAEKDIIDFFEKNKENCVLSVLWHNNFFSNYKFRGYLDLYKKILMYIHDNQFTTITQSEIIHNYSIQ